MLLLLLLILLLVLLGCSLVGVELLLTAEAKDQVGLGLLLRCQS